MMAGSQARATDVSGVIAANTTWTAAGNPYNLVGNVVVNSGVTLTIEPGVQLVASHYSGIIVRGSLSAAGTDSDPIVMDGSTASPGWWRGIHVEDAGSASLNHLQISNGGYYTYAAIMKSGTGDLTLRNSLVRRSSHAGLKLTAGYGTFVSESNAFEDNNDGIVLGTDTSFSDTTSTFSGNTFAAVTAIGGHHTKAVSWELSASYAIVIAADQIVDAAASLTLKPGLVVKAVHYAGFVVDGELVAEGTTSKPIVLTDYRDDSVGGDTANDGTATAPSPGWWAGISVRNAGSASLDHCEIAYGGYYYYANLYKSGTGSLSLRHSTLRRSSHAGLKLTSGYGSFLSESNAYTDNADGIRLGLNTTFTDTTSTFSGNSYAPVVIGGGHHTTAVSWELSSDYAIVIEDSQIIDAGASLTLKPGLVVKHAHYAGIYVDGQLTAEGSAVKPIVFTDYRDDTVGGDTGHDGTDSSPAPGWWAGITVRNTGSASLDHCEIAYCGYYNYAGVYKSGTGNLSLRHSTLRKSSHAGLKLTSGYGSFLSESNAFRDNADGIRLGLNTSFSDTTSTFEGNSFAPVAADGGTHTTDVSWQLSPSYSIVLADSQLVGAAGSLTLMPGLVVKAVHYAGLRVSGELLALGTPGSPIHFTDYRDDAVGGDSNHDADASLPAPHWWAGVKVNPGGSATLENCRVGYTGYYEYGGVKVEGDGTLNLADSTIHSGGESGLYLYQASGIISVNGCLFTGNRSGVHVRETSQGVTIGSCRFEGNKDYGMVNSSSVEVDARSNWWGDASGPFHTTLNPDGTGDRVSNGVLFEPWRTSSGVEGILAPRLSGTIVAGDSLRFIGSPASNAADGYWWDFGDGRNSSVQNPGLVRFSRTGDFEIAYAVVVDGEIAPFVEGRTYAVVANTGDFPDLRLDRLTVPANVGVGETVTIDYAVTNVGPGALAESTWTDAIYVSEDEYLDATDTVVDSKSVTRSLGKDESYSGQFEVMLPAIEDGVRHLIVSVNDEWSPVELHRLNNEGAESVRITVPGLEAGQVLSGSHPVGRSEQYFRIPATGGKSLLVTFGHDVKGLTAVIKFGTLPTRSVHDHLLEDGTLVIPAATKGDWYILVYGDGLLEEGDFTLEYSEADLALTSVSPRMQDSAAELELNLVGAGFAGSIEVDLVSSGGADFAADSAIVASFTNATAVFAAGRLPAGRYHVRVTQGGHSSMLDDAVEMVSGGAPDFHVNVITPSVMGYHQLATLFVEYENRGTAPMPAPLLVLTPRQNEKPGALLTQDRSLLSQGFWTSAIPRGFATSIRLLAGGEQPGVLMPGESMRIPVYYAGWLKPWDFSYPPFKFDVVTSTADDDQVVPWTSLKDALRPEAESEAAWDAVWQNLSTALGTTMGDFVTMLSRNAVYLSRIGVDVRDVGQLFTFELQKARGLIGPMSELTGTVDLATHRGLISLNVLRSFPRNLTQRYRLGPLGYGWNHGWEVQLAKEADGTVVLTRGNGATHTYQPDSRSGTYFSTKGDRSKLAAQNDGHRLTLTNGTMLFFDASGRLTRAEDRHGLAISLQYTSGRLSHLEHSNGLSITITYNGSGLISRIDDSLGHRVSYTYDGDKHLVAVTDRKGNETTYDYAPSDDPRKRHALTGITQPGGVVQTFTYDTQGRLATHHNGLGVSRFAYDQGNLTVTNGAGLSTTASYSHRGVLTRMIDAEGGLTTIEEDPQDRSVRIRSADGSSVLQVYDRDGALRRMINQEGAEWQFETGAFNQPGITTSPTGRTFRREYDVRGNLTRTVQPDGTTAAFAHTSSGWRSGHTNALGITEETTYNAFGQAVEKRCSDGSTRTFEYDAKNRLVKATNAEGTTRFTYDAVGNLVRVAYPNGLDLEYAYDDADRLVASIDPNGQASRLAYNAGGLVDRLMDEDGNVLVRYVYDGAGRLVEKQLPDDVTTVYERNGRGQITRQTTRDGSGAVLADFRADYDSSGLLTRYQTPQGVTVYTYDPAGHLSSLAFEPASGPTETVQYNRDPDGLLESLVINGQETAVTVDAAGRYVGFGSDEHTYDAVGNLASREIGSDTINYSRNAIGKVVEIETGAGDYQIRYDALGTPLEVSGPGMSVNYLYDGLRKSMLVGEYEADGDPIRTYQNGLEMSVVHYDGKTYLPEYDPIEGDPVLALTLSSTGSTAGDDHPVAHDQPPLYPMFQPPYRFPGFDLPQPGDFGYGTPWMLLEMAGPHIRRAISPTGFGVKGSFVDQVLSTMSDSDTAEGGLMADVGFVSGLTGLFGGLNSVADGLGDLFSVEVVIMDPPDFVTKWGGEVFEVLTGDRLGNVLNGFGLVFSGFEVITGISETWSDNRSIDMNDVLNPFGSTDGGTMKIRHGLATGAMTLLGMAAAGGSGGRRVCDHDQ
ncbi:MAG: right-handed parallel beta-helix repeat-containing protein [Opitutaceae bacterium]